MDFAGQMPLFALVLRCNDYSGCRHAAAPGFVLKGQRQGGAAAVRTLAMRGIPQALGWRMSIYDSHLDKTAANFAALTPVGFVERSAEVFGDLPATVHGARRYTWAQVRERSARLAAALRALGVGHGSTVSTMLPNTPEMAEAHYAIPALGAVINTLNTRLDAPLLAWQMNHCEAAVLITDREFAPTIGEALRLLRDEHGRRVTVVDVCDTEYTGPGERLGEHEYEALLAAHAPLARLDGPADEWDAIAVSYTSGTTGDPKGVVTHHRGAYLNAVCNAATWTMPHFPKYLWTLPMFHCNGWCFPWTVAMLGGTHVCLRKVEAKAILDAMREHGVDHYCAAPIVHNLLVNAPAEWRAGIRQKVRGMVAGAAPPAAMIEGMAKIGFDITHVYGLTEVYGPAAVAVKRDSWAGQSLSEQTRLNGRQGVRYMLQDGMTVLDPETLAETPADGQTMGEIMFRGNIVMKGYLKNPAATGKAFAGGWFHTGDLAVMEPDRYVKIKDRSKDVIISGGENISSIEVEDALYRHPAVLACAVVARPDPKWGETPVAYVETKADSPVTAAELIAHCKTLLAGYKVPREIRFEPIPKTSTGKIQKFQLRERAKSSSAIE
jgi:fatty-acyl-CoA synthase